MRKVWGAAVAVAMMCGMSACSGAGTQFLLNDVKLKNLDKDLGEIEKSWRSDFDGGKKRANFGKDARCYAVELRVDDKKRSVLDGRVICGPMRTAGSDRTLWTQLPVRPSTDSKSSGQMVRAGEAKQLAQPQGTFRRADGKRPDLSATVDEAGLPDAKAGDVIKVRRAQDDIAAGSSSVKWSKEQTLKTPEGEFVVRVARADKAGLDSERRQAPRGGSFFFLDVHPLMTAVSSDYPDSGGHARDSSQHGTWTVRSKGKSYDVGNAGDHMSAAVAVDGSGSDDALEYTYADVTQQITVDGELKPGKAGGMYSLPRTNSVSMDKASVGDGLTGSHVALRLDNTRAYTAGYDTGLGWPGDGNMWMAVVMPPALDFMRFYQPGRDNRSFSGYTDSVDISDGGEWKCDGQPVKKISVVNTSGPNRKAILYCAVPAKPAEHKLTGSFKVHGEKSTYDKSDWSPKTQDVTVPVSGATRLG